MVDESTRVAIVSNGFADGPAQALRDFLVGYGATVTTVFHPLVAEAGKRHEIARYREGGLVGGRTVTLPLGPPASFAFDSLVPWRMPEVDTWFGFNSLATTRGLRARGRGRARRVVHWCVDFVPDRFGRRSPVTTLYDTLDRRCCRRADLRIELSATARDARAARHRLTPAAAAPVEVVPMGAWVDRTPKVPEDAWRSRRVVFLGHLVERQGVRMLLDAMDVLQARSTPVTATVIGGGPLESELRAAAGSRGLSEQVEFLGFVEDHREVERVLAEASVAVAPYEPGADNFTRFADPGEAQGVSRGRSADPAHGRPTQRPRAGC